MKRLIQLILMLVLMASVAQAEDIDVFSDCDNAIPPNVLVIFDTSLSMRNQDAYDDSIRAYAHGKTDWASDMKYDEPYRLYYKPSKGGLWLTLGSLWGDKISHLSDVTCQEAIDDITSKGYFEGELSSHTGECGGTLVTSKIVASGNYLNYIRYVEREMEKVSFAKGQENGSSGTDLDHYCPSTDYYNYHGDGMGYGDYAITDGSYKRALDRVYHKIGGTYFHFSGNTKVEDIACVEVKSDLLSNGWSKRKIKLSGDNSCPSKLLSWAVTTKLLMTRNFINYLDMKRSRRYNGIDALYDVIQARHHDVNFGIMQFDLGHFPTFSSWKSDGGDLAAPCGASLADIKRVLYTHTSDADKEYGQPLHFGRSKSDIGKETPLAESLIEAGLYFAGQPSWFNSYTMKSSFFSADRSYHTGTTVGRSYMSPIECPEQGNHVIIITDGAPSDDFALVDPSFPDEDAIKTWNFRTYLPNGKLTADDASKIGDYDKDKEFCLSLFGVCFDQKFKQTWVDDVADFLADKDLSPLEGTQPLHTHAISFRMDADAPQANEWLLNNTAKNGEGHFFVVGGQSAETANQSNADTMREALSKALTTIVASAIKTSTFSSAVTPVRQDDLTYSGDETLLTTFHVSSDERGEGNVKKFSRSGDVIMGLKGGASSPLVGAGGVQSGVKDLWSKNFNNSANEDAPQEGVAGVLFNRLAGITFQENADWSAKLNKVANDRKIYGVKVTVDNGDHPKYHVKDLRTMAMGLSPKAFSEAYDVKADDVKADGGTYGVKDLQQFLTQEVYGLALNWPLGHIVHTDVVVAQYPISGGHLPMLFVGANDGMLHCFDMGTGQEIWALVPPDQTKRLFELTNTLVHPWFIDGQMVLYHTKPDTGGGEKRAPTLLIFGERRGGSAYHLVNVAQALNNAPKYVSMVGGDSPWGQSWSTPQLCQIVRAAGVKDFGFLVGGGYDTNQDLDTQNPPVTDSLGRFVALYDLEGEMIREFTEYYDASGDSHNIEACIVGARIVDHDHDGARIFSRIYAGDLAGNVYHFADELRKGADGKWKTMSFERPADCGDGEIEGDCSVMDGTWPRRHKLFEPKEDDGTKVKQKIFYAPMYGKGCGIDMVYAGTGDREKPEDKTVINSVYAIRERWEQDAGDLSDHDTLIRSDLACFQIGDSIGNVDGSESYNETATVADLSEFKGWYFDFERDGEKVISEISVVNGNLIFGTYTPKETEAFTSRCGASNECITGEGRVYIVNACPLSFDVKSIVTKGQDPMPQPALIYDKESGNVLISTGDGEVYDSGLPVVKSEYWKSSTSGQ
ncbi:pilus assembly protein [Desulfoluna sp.]|uniref:pilus assembly protein n=1 Tax=Desulfoluna sp. TaxID=2045199 RepID=UPI002626BA98|nr:PilC/PilY family type IV pilus protein [Desulfoluna sp.]